MPNPILSLRHKIALAIRDVHGTRAELADLRQQVADLPANTNNLLGQVTDLRLELSELRRELSDVRGGVSEVSAQTDARTADIRTVIDALQVLCDHEPENRRRLYALRESAEYEPAFTEREPLVSVLIPTYTSFGSLRDRAIPSVLAQTYENWELVVIGDAAPPETARIIKSFGDGRISYQNLSLRGPYPEDRQKAWLVSGVPPFNAGMRAARGRWIAPFSDDDTLNPQALARNIEEAQKHRTEFNYSHIRLLGNDDLDVVLNEFPPHLWEIALQGSMFHAGLRFFEQELADAVFGAPNDWSMVRRMMRAGVRIGFIREILATYYPSYRNPDVDAPFRKGAHD